MKVAVYAATLFASALLLFAVQPMIARFALPGFGGGAGVWSACLLFFQTLLVAGYLYVHAITKLLSLRRQILLHASLLLVSLIFLPITPSLSLRAGAVGSPIFELLLLLVTALGLPSLLLCCSAPLLQRLLPGARDVSVFRLYAVSNLGSLLGLVLYPLAVEPALGLVAQSRLWSAGYLVFALGMCLCLGMAWQGSGASALDAAELESEIAPSTRAQRALWLSLSFSGVVLFLSVSNQLSINILPLPLLWVLPLALYLISYVLCFARDAWYHRRAWSLFYGLSVIPTLLLSSMPLLFGAYLAVAVSCMGVFAGCMVCHGELAALRPNKSELTGFYLYLAIGGALGSAFVNLAAPLLFSRYWELQVGIFGALACLGLCAMRRHRLVREARARAHGVELVHDSLRSSAPILAWLSCCAVLALVCSHPLRQDEGTIAAERNFYGRLSVVESGSIRYLLHGRIRHGGQDMEPSRRREPTLYYASDSGVALALERLSASQGRRIGIVGLGVGTLASYGRTGDLFRFYELDPMVESMARHYFSFLADSNARVELAMGDARLVLEDERTRGSMDYDLLVLDAFSSDAVPTHLLTREAFALYWQHLAADGVLAVNVSNTFINLVPLLRAHAEALGKTCRWIVAAPSRQSVSGSSWLLVGSGDSFAGDVLLIEQSQRLPSASRHAWSDDHSSLFELLR